MIIELEIDYDVLDMFFDAFCSREEVNYREIKLAVTKLGISKRDLTLARWWLGVKSVKYPNGSRYWILKHDSEGWRKLNDMEQQNQ